MSPQMRRRVSLAIFGILLAALASPVWAQKPLAIYVLDFDTNIAGENHAVAVTLATSIETAFSQRNADFKVLERRNLNEIVRQNKLEQDLHAVRRGDRPSDRFITLSHADGFLHGELKDDHLGGVVLTLSLIKLDSVKLWQSQKTHTLYEWLNGELRAKDAAELAASAAASVNASAKLVLPIATDDAVRGIELARQGHCSEAMPFLTNAAVVDYKNTEVFYQLGRCHNQAGEYDLAVISLGSAIGTNSRRSDLFVERAMSLSALKESQPALLDLDQALKIDSGNLTAIELRGDILMQRGLYADAVNAYYEVYQQQPTSSRCKKLAAAYRRNGASDRSLMLERTCGSLPSEPQSVSPTPSASGHHAGMPSWPDIKAGVSSKYPNVAKLEPLGDFVCTKSPDTTTQVWDWPWDRAQDNADGIYCRQDASGIEQGPGALYEVQIAAVFEFSQGKWKPWKYAIRRR